MPYGLQPSGQPQRVSVPEFPPNISTKKKPKDPKEVFTKVAAILGYSKVCIMKIDPKRIGGVQAKEVTEKYPHVLSPNLLIEYALDGAPEAVDGTGDEEQGTWIH